MKRVLTEDQFRRVYEETRAKSKYQTLLEDYLSLKKDVVSKKRKHKAMNQTRETLLAEVRFLRRRRRYLLKIQSPKPEAEQEVVQRQNSDVHSELPVKKRKYSVNNEAAVENPCPVMDINQTPGGDWEPLLVEKMPKSCLFSGKKVGKKKISWQDPVALEV